MATLSFLAVSLAAIFGAFLLFSHANGVEKVQAAVGLFKDTNNQYFSGEITTHEEVRQQVLFRRDGTNTTSSTGDETSTSSSSSIDQSTLISSVSAFTSDSFSFSSSLDSSFSSAAVSQTTSTSSRSRTSSQNPITTVFSSTTEEETSTTSTSPTTSASASPTTRVYSSVENGKTIYVTETSMVTQPTAAPSSSSSRNNSSNASGGLSNTNKIVVGVVVGVGGAVLLGFLALVFILKRRGSKGQESGWTFWRKNEKGGEDNFFSGELGVRDRDINQGSNF